MAKAETGIGRRTGLLLFAAATLTACAPRRPAASAPIDVFAAASLREVLDAAVAGHGRRSGTIVRTTYAGSAQLARQIAQGAPADLFIPADEAWMDWLDQRGLIETAARRRLAANRLVLIAPVSAPGAAVDLTSPAAFGRRLGDGRLAIAETTVPAGRYGREALIHLNLWPGVRDRLAPAADVRAALALVARGEAPLGLVYATDARVEPRVRVVAEIPAASHAPIVYPAAPIRRRDGAGDPEGARAFLDVLAGAGGQALFQRFGFVPAPV
ncbi:molybdate ABC transporter substrate-binding protein [Brevundimonas sp.]|uniref:molybdate ABC transporter substrate-binding protein n=1 Tax=Brevundimonas sp. TaxID=1871086 RepID=UPI0027378406|nr:molybdate ABC transporter substrate-binding protein [Brevundimonas sp.]MDP3801915.1 molybdate ABC transporter substrate-binding protein [Brevundimonas sp.]